ncbi:hypothetical protein GCM10027199_82440 [Amycolatopsis magusensis]
MCLRGGSAAALLAGLDDELAGAGRWLRLGPAPGTTAHDLRLVCLAAWWLVLGAGVRSGPLECGSLASSAGGVEGVTLWCSGDGFLDGARPAGLGPGVAAW